MSGRHFGAIVGLLVTLSACTVAHRLTYVRRSTPAVASGRLDVNRLLSAIEYLESSHKNYPPYKDGRELAFGYFALHRARWAELGGNPREWGKASAEVQRGLMRRALVRKQFQTFEQVARWHNGAGRAHYAYAEKLRRAYEQRK